MWSKGMDRNQRYHRNRRSSMSTEYMQGWRWIVWVGGVDDYYTNYERAKKHYDEWIEEGYDDVIIEEITQ